MPTFATSRQSNLCANFCSSLITNHGQRGRRIALDAVDGSRSTDHAHWPEVRCFIHAKTPSRLQRLGGDLDLAQKIRVRAVDHDDEWVAFQSKPPFAVVNDDVQGAHSVAHGAAREVSSWE